MEFPISGVETSPLVPLLVSFVISLVTSTGGVSGAFLLLPFQMGALGFTSPAVSATNQLYNVVAIPSGVYRYFREGRMVWPLTWAIVLGTLPGVFVGALVRVRYLPDPGRFKVFAGLVLLYVAGRMVRDLWAGRRGPTDAEIAEKGFHAAVAGKRHDDESAGGGRGGVSRAVVVRRFGIRRIAYDFHGESFEISTIRILALGIVVGVVGGAYGIGGGAIIAPFLVTFFRLPVYTVAGAALMGTFITSVAGVAFYRAIAPFYPDMAVGPDWLLGTLFGIGGLAGMYCGARLQKYVPAHAIKGVLGVITLFLGARWILAFLVSGTG